MLAGCVTPPAALRGDAYAPVSPAEAAADPRTGAYVRWGGRILDVTHDAEQTCFDVLGLPLDTRARPRRTDATQGRFRACATGFYDPAVYARNRAITTVGTIGLETTQRFDSYELRMPVLTADVVYLWPQRRYDDAYLYAYAPYPYFGWGWGWPYAPFAWGPYYGPFWRGPYFGPWRGVGWRAPGFSTGRRAPYPPGSRVASRAPASLGARRAVPARPVGGVGGPRSSVGGR